MPGLKGWFNRKKAKFGNGRLCRTIKEMQRVDKTIPSHNDMANQRNAMPEKGKAFEKATGQKTVELK